MWVAAGKEAKHHQAAVLKIVASGRLVMWWQSKADGVQSCSLAL